MPARATFLPFGIGVRFCIGMHFALTEATLSLSMLLQHFRFVHEGVPPEMDMAVTIRPKGGMSLIITPVEEGQHSLIS